jgi:1,4-dihydroxy-2-naphthoate octaprenyltransferase
MIRFVDALRTVPRVDAAGWAALPWWTRWAIASRASVLGMTLVSAAIGGLLALSHPQFSFGLWLVAAVGLVAAHASNNLINDWVDSLRGLDKGDYHRARYGTHALGAGMMSHGQMALYVAATAGVALGAAAIAFGMRGAATGWLALAGAFFVLFYTWPLKSLGLGEPAVLLVWGPLMTGGAFLVACGEWSWKAAALGAVYGLGPTAVLFGKHIDKLEADAARGIRTLPVMLGEARARLWVRVMVVLQPAVPALLALLGLASPWLLLVLLAAMPARRALEAFAGPRPAERPDDYPAEVWPLWYAHFAFVLTRRMGALLVLALLLAAVTG